LTRLETLNADWARVVELRYFGGLTIDETAMVLEMSTATVERAWRAARAWLYTQLAP
jgi:DNA-directed RNA polymerase specialized sigma24 family protein